PNQHAGASSLGVPNVLPGWPTEQPPRGLRAPEASQRGGTRLIGALGGSLARAELGHIPRRLAVLTVGLGALLVTILAVRAADAWFVHLLLDHTASRAADEVQLGLVDHVTPADFVPPF